MTQPLPAPISRTVPHLVDLTDRDTRVRLTRDGFVPVLRMLDTWNLTTEDRAALLGLKPRTLQRYIAEGVRELDIDQLTRMSLIVGIHKALNVLYNSKNASAWPTRPNRRPIFGGRPPLHLMLEGIPALLLVRRLLDADRGGVAERQDPEIEARAQEVVSASLAQLPEDF